MLSVVLGSRLYVAPSNIPYRQDDQPIDGRRLASEIAARCGEAIVRLVPAWLDGVADVARRIDHIVQGMGREAITNRVLGDGGNAADVAAAIAAEREASPDSARERAALWRDVVAESLDLYNDPGLEAVAVAALSRWCTEVQTSDGAAVLGDDGEPVTVGRFDVERCDAGRAELLHTAAQLAHLWGAFPLPAGIRAGQRATAPTATTAGTPRR